MDEEYIYGDFIPKKRKLKSSELSELSSPKDADSWRTLLKAAEIKGFSPITGIFVNENEVPELFYHRQCRSTFTLKKSINALLNKEQELNEITGSDQSRKSQRDVAGIYLENKQCFLIWMF